MSQRLTLGDLRNSRITRAVNICPEDERFPQWVNNFQERAFALGRWWGSTQLLRLCVSSSCVVLPREVAVIEAANFNCCGGIAMRNSWHQFIRPHACCDGTYNRSHALPICTGGRRGCSCCGCSEYGFEDRDTVSSFGFTNAGQKIRIYPGGASDEGKKIILKGYDSNGVWVRTSFDGIVQDGEQVTLALPFVNSATTWGAGNPLGVLKDETDYRVLMYALDVSTATETHQIADYQPSETRPMYRRMSLPGNCSSSTQTIQAIVSLQHIPVVDDNDFLLFQNLAAYTDGVLGEIARENGDHLKADAYFYGLPKPSRNMRGVLRHSYGMGAIPLLEAELRKQTGDRTSVSIQHDGVNLAGFI